MGRALAGAAMACVFAAVASAPAAAAPAVTIDVVSNRADLISGGDALVAVGIPAGIPSSSVHVRVGTRDVTSAFDQRPNGRFEGLISGLAIGPNVIKASAAQARRASMPI